jgi:hypothetical protein
VQFLDRGHERLRAARKSVSQGESSALASALDTLPFLWQASKTSPSAIEITHSPCASWFLHSVAGLNLDDGFFNERLSSFPR